MSKETQKIVVSPDRKRQVESNLDFPKAEDIFRWVKDNHSLTSREDKNHDLIDVNLGFPSGFGGTWGGDDTMIRYVDFNPYFHGRPVTIMVPENNQADEKVVNLRKKRVTARVLLGNPYINEFGISYSMSDDGKWYRESGKLKIYDKDSTSWHPRGSIKEVTDVFSRDQIEDIVRREGSVYTKKRA